MANLCFNEVVLLGEPNILKNIVNTIEELWKSTKYNRTTLEKLQEKLQFDCEGWGRSYDSGLDQYNNERIDAGELRLYSCTAWGPVPDYWKALCDKFGLKFAYMCQPDSDYYVENDCECRYFPVRYVLDTYGSEDYEDLEYQEFESLDDTLKYLSDYFQCTKTFEEWVEFLGDEDIANLIEVERDGGQAINPYKVA